MLNFASKTHQSATNLNYDKLSAVTKMQLEQRKQMLMNQESIDPKLLHSSLNHYRVSGPTLNQMFSLTCL